MTQYKDMPTLDKQYAEFRASISQRLSELETALTACDDGFKSSDKYRHFHLSILADADTALCEIGVGLEVRLPK